MVAQLDSRTLKEKLSNRAWRLCNLYSCLDKDGRIVPFRPNFGQRRLYNQLWWRNSILKARQIGFTTFIQIYMLDSCLWNPNTRAGVIAHNKEDAAKFFRDKIKKAYEHLDPRLKKLVPTIGDSKTELEFANGSAISVGTSHRSGTLQLLHISEFGKICARHPDKAREIVTGSFEAVPKNGVIFVESTAEGRSGAFYDMCKAGQDAKLANLSLSPLDFRFHFYPWWEMPDYSLPEPVVYDSKMADYFAKVEKQIDRKLTPEQRWWYASKWKTLGDDLKREYPATPDEAFEQAIQGAYFSEQFRKIREEGRICRIPLMRGIAVDTYWDLGYNDTNCIWFGQNVGRELHWVDYYENHGEGLPHYATVLQERAKERGYAYGRHFGPHDIDVHELGTGKTRKETAAALGITFQAIPRCEKKADSIEAARNLLSYSWFDEERCSLGVTRLENYRKEWDDRLGCFKSSPRHDENSNGADAFQTAGLGHTFTAGVRARQVKQAWGTN